MQLVSHAFAQRPGPVVDGALRLGQITNVIGANDAGKSRLVADLSRTLERAGDGGAFYAVLDDDEREAVLGHHVRRTSRLRRDRSAAEQAAQDHPLRDALLESFVFAFAPAGDGWRCWWCLPPVEELDEHARQHVQGRPGAAPEMWPLARLSQLSDVPAAMWQPGLPVAAVAVGEVPLAALPVPRMVPSSFDAALAEGAALIDELVRYARWFEAAREDFGALLALDGREMADEETSWAIRDALEELAPAPDPSWTVLEANGATLRRLPVVDVLVDVVSAAATQALPPFVADRYALEVQAAPLTDTSGRRLAAQLRLEGTDVRFPVEDVADGLRLWVELALREGFDDLRAMGAAAAAAVGSLRFEEEEIADAVDLRDRMARALEDEEPPPDAENDHIWAGHRLEDSAGDVLEAATTLEAVARGARPPDQPRSPSMLAGTERRPLYVLDEPERHLHPRLQRAASRWLADLSATRGVQAIVITHSVPFMRPRPATEFCWVRRAGEGSIAEPIRAEQLEALNAITSSLGLDRGELLGGVSVILFVEGRSDQLVLESLFGPRLRAAGVVIAPIHGILRTRGIVDADLLLRFTTARVAMLIDDVEQAVIREMLDDPSALAAHSRGKHPERKAIARLILDARENDREVEPFGISKHDIFDLLDDEALEARFPKWPGHEAAAAALARAGDIHPKKFREREYGIPVADVVYYAEVADLMRDRPPAELAALMDELERYALWETLEP